MKKIDVLKLQLHLKLNYTQIAGSITKKYVTMKREKFAIWYVYIKGKMIENKYISMLLLNSYSIFHMSNQRDNIAKKNKMC